MLALGLGIASATPGEISRSVPGSITINVVSIEALADVDGNGIVDQRDLMAVTGRLGTPAAPGEPEDVNRDGIIDVLDLAVIARFLGLEV